MAKSKLRGRVKEDKVAATHPTYVARDESDPQNPVPAVPTAGMPVRVGQRPGVAMADATADQTTRVSFEGEFSLSVKGVDGVGNDAVDVGDILYYVDGDTPVLSKKDTGVRFGYANGAVTSGATATIPVILGY